LGLSFVVLRIYPPQAENKNSCFLIRLRYTFDGYILHILLIIVNPRLNSLFWPAPAETAFPLVVLEHGTLVGFTMESRLIGNPWTTALRCRKNPF
jgi:hypothetical protein